MPEVLPSVFVLTAMAIVALWLTISCGRSAIAAATIDDGDDPRAPAYRQGRDSDGARARALGIITDIAARRLRRHTLLCQAAILPSEKKIGRGDDLNSDDINASILPHSHADRRCGRMSRAREVAVAAVDACPALAKSPLPFWMRVPRSPTRFRRFQRDERRASCVGISKGCGFEGGRAVVFGKVRDERRLPGVVFDQGRGDERARAVLFDRDQGQDAGLLRVLTPTGGAPRRRKHAARAYLSTWDLLPPNHGPQPRNPRGTAPLVATTSPTTRTTRSGRVPSREGS